MAKSRYYPELRKLQKRANQRIVRLEQMGVKSPAYEAIQGKLEILGRQTSGDRGRRFSETGKATYNEYEHQKKVLLDFLDMQTSTQAGAKQWENDIWQGALDSEKGLKLKEAGITKDQWLEFWKNMPGNHKDRMFGSEVVVKMLRTYTYKNRKLSDDQKMTPQEIAEAIQAQTTIKSAYKQLGITYKDVKKVNNLGEL